VKFLRPITVDTGESRAVGTVLNRGRRTALAEARLLDPDDRLLAHPISSYMLFEACQGGNAGCPDGAYGSGPGADRFSPPATGAFDAQSR
jgi:hypothetical protein